MIVCWAGDGLGELLNCLPKNDDMKWLSSTIKTCLKMMIRCDYHQPSKLGRLFHGSVVVYDPTSYWCAQKHLFLSYGINGCLCPPLPCRARPRAHIVVAWFFMCHVDVVPHCFAALAALLATKRHVMHPWRLEAVHVRSGHWAYWARCEEPAQVNPV